jgi:hypothetical protein
MPPTPVPRSELLSLARELRDLVEELAELTDGASAWTARLLRRNLQLALLSPGTLDSADNQLDFIEELAEAVWDGADVGFRFTVRPAPTAETAHRWEKRRQVVVERLDEITHRLCTEAEAWQDQAIAAAERQADTAPYPQDDHRS